MALGQCQICKSQEARYKCPKCYVAYCRLDCFKSPLHIHDSKPESEEPSQEPTKELSKETSNDIDQDSSTKDDTSDLLQRIADDHVIKSMLSYKSLRAHLSVLLKLLLDSSITKEPIYENRKEIANMRLCELRIGGSEENELVEEFVQRVLHLQNEFSSSR